jgi:hypothetical protein
MRNVLLIGVVAGLALESCLDFSQCTWCVDGGSDAGCAPNLWTSQLGSYPTQACAVVDAGFVLGAGVGEFSCDAGALSVGTEFLNLPTGTEVCAHANASGGRGGRLEVSCSGCPPDGGCKCSQQSGCLVSITSLGPQTVGPFRVPALNCQTLDVYFAVADSDAGLVPFTDAWVWQPSADGGCSWNAAASCPTP